MMNNRRLDSFVIAALRAELELRDIDWNTAPGFKAFDRLLDFVNIRFYRGSGKSSVITHGGTLYHMTRDPNETIALMSVNDDAAAGFARQIRETLMSDLYQFWFPERVPDGDLSKIWTEKRIVLGGRTIPAKEATLEARGITSGWARTHFNRIRSDDIVTDGCDAGHLKEVRKRLGNMRGLYMPQVRMQRMHVGTVWDEEDDHSVFRKIPDCLTIVVPIETYDGPAPEDMTVRGRPTNPEWHDEEYIKATFSETVADEEQGPLAYKRNFWLDPTVATGDRLFPPSLVDRSKYEITRNAQNEQRARRPKRDESWQVVSWLDPNGKPQPLLDTKGKPITNGSGQVQYKPDFELFDPFKDFFIVLGVDPAYSKGGDDWAITALGTDFQDCHFQLETVAGKGWEGLQVNLLIMAERWRPHVIGYEKAGSSEQTFQTLLTYNRKFRRWASKFKPISHKNEQKEWRIANRVMEPMKMGKLLLSPSPQNQATLEEMKKYVPGPKAIDNRLDSIAIAMSIARKGRSAVGDWRKALEDRARRHKARQDPITGVRIA
jgi:hypothetical protein